MPVNAVPVCSLQEPLWCGWLAVHLLRIFRRHKASRYAGQKQGAVNPAVFPAGLKAALCRKRAPEKTGRVQCPVFRIEAGGRAGRARRLSGRNMKKQAGPEGFALPAWSL